MIYDEDLKSLRRSLDRMKTCAKISIVLALLSIILCLTSCGTTRHLPQETVQSKDSTKVEIREKTVYVRDTVILKIPAQTAERETQDSTSHLENEYAASDARINKDGSLYHDLKTKPQDKPVEFDKPVETRDSIIYRTQYIDRVQTAEVERELSWWQKTQMYGFWVALAAIAVICRKKIFSILKLLIRI